jgi:[acyl-carrier-protein] S-malonyltransferase
MVNIAALFSGQGSQYIGMGKELYDNFSVAKETFEEASEILGIDIKKLCFYGSLEELSRTKNTQPALLTTSVAQFRVYMEEIGLKVSYFAGHSIGEYSALVCSEAISFKDALRLVRARGRLMEEASGSYDGSMAVIRGIDEVTIEEECKKFAKDNIIGISNYNGDQDVVISGNCHIVDKIREKFRKQGAVDIKLNVNGAFHSLMMEEAAEKLKAELEKYIFSTPKARVLSNVTAVPYESTATIADLLFKQIKSPVKWTQIMRCLDSSGVDTCIEFGTKATLRNLAKVNMNNVVAYSYDRKEDINNLKDMYLKNCTLVSRSLGIAIATKNYNENNNAFKSGVIEPYKKIQELQFKLEQEGKKPNFEQMNEAINMLKSVFSAKMISKEEQIERFEEILEETNSKQYFPSVDFDNIP